MTIIEETFRSLRDKDEAALIAYVTAGDPSPKYTLKIVDALVEGGADIIELGVPFSDPIADGPTIQAATIRALNAGTTPPLVMRIAKEIRRKRQIPIVLLTYYNILHRMGLRNFLFSAKTCGVEGLVIPDLPFEEAAEYKKTAQSADVDTIFLATPSTTTGRLHEILEYTSGFLYMVALFGVTGARRKLQESTIELVERILPHTKSRIPLAAGFGISTPEHVKKVVAAGADGAIVGSAFVDVIEQNRENVSRATEKLRKMSRNFKMATRR